MGLIIFLAIIFIFLIFPELFLAILALVLVFLEFILRLFGKSFNDDVKEKEKEK